MTRAADDWARYCEGLHDFQPHAQTQQDLLDLAAFLREQATENAQLRKHLENQAVADAKGRKLVGPWIVERDALRATCDQLRKALELLLHLTNPLIVPDPVEVGRARLNASKLIGRGSDRP